MRKMNQNGTKIKCKKLILFDQFGDSVRCRLSPVGEMQLAKAMTTADDNEGVMGLINSHAKYGLFLYKKYKSGQEFLCCIITCT